MRGRKPLPNVLKIVKGSRRPLNPDEPRPSLAPADAPPANLDAAARRVWSEAMPELARLGIFTTLDVGRVARTCALEAQGRRWLVRARQAKAARDARALLLMAGKCFELADKVWCAFGVAAPGERARLRTPPKEEDRLGKFRKTYR